MSAELARVPFRSVDVAVNTPLHKQLATVKDVEGRRNMIRGLRRKLAWAGLFNMVPSLGWLGWVAHTLYYEQGYVFRFTEYSEFYKWDFNWSFITGPVYDGLSSSFVATVVGLIATALTFALGLKLDASNKIIVLTTSLVAGVSLLAIAYLMSSAMFSIFPLVSWAIIIGLAIALSKFSHLVPPRSYVNDDESLVRDNRFEEYSSFLELQNTWNEWAQLLNRYQLKLEHRQFSPGMVPTVRKALEAMRADEQFVHDRLAYLHAVAGEGDLGSRTARAQLGASVIHDLTGRMNDMRTRVKELQDLDAKAIAALQVEKGKY